MLWTDNSDAYFQNQNSQLLNLTLGLLKEVFYSVCAQFVLAALTKTCWPPGRPDQAIFSEREHSDHIINSPSTEEQALFSEGVNYICSMGMGHGFFDYNNPILCP